MAFQEHNAQRKSALMQEMVEGEGFSIGTIEFEKICVKYNVDIDSAEELAAVVNDIAKRAQQATDANKSNVLPENGFRPIFEHFLLNERGYPAKVCFSSQILKQPTRFQAKVIKPLQPASTKVLVDNSPESRLYRFFNALIEDTLNVDSDTKYEVSEMSIIDSHPECEMQPRHTDFEEHNRDIHDCSFLVAIEERGSLCVCKNSHHLVAASNIVSDEMIPEAKAFSRVESMLQAKKQLSLRDFKMETVYFGTDQFCCFLDTFLHGGAPNTMRKIVRRLHCFASRKGVVVQSNNTFFSSELVWDVTRQDNDKKIFLSDCLKNKHMAELLKDDSSDDEEEESNSIKNNKRKPNEKDKASDKEKGKAPVKRGRPRKENVP